MSTLKLIYNDLKRRTIPVEIDKLSKGIFMKLGTFKNIHIFSLYELPENIRKVTVYAVVEYIFRAYKFGVYDNKTHSITPVPEHSRYPLLFILEEV